MSKSLKRRALTATVIMGLCSLAMMGPAVAQDQAIEVGADAPGFTLKNQENEDVDLEALLQESNVALVFYRSASW